MSATEAPSQLPSSVWIRGGERAPARARRYLLSQLDGDTSALRAAEAALIASELVTNSVVHANVGTDDLLMLEVTALGDHLRIAVIDPGSELEPRIRRGDPEMPGGFGLCLVERLSSAWGVERGPSGNTRVWCELRLHGQDRQREEAR